MYATLRSQGLGERLCLLATLCVLVNLPVCASAYSWQEPHATVLPNGDLEWAPQPFVYSPGASVRYIDYEGGNDRNLGTSTGSPFKHHPWDPNATGNAAACSGIHTYVFKRGVVYRGTLVADESGATNNPIILTSDTAWGTGDACLYGSERITSGWTRCSTGDAPALMPNPTDVWYYDLGSTVPNGQWTSTVCELRSDTLYRLALARSPNWTIVNPNDPMGTWWRFTGEGTGTLIDARNLTQTEPNYWIGGTIWSQYGVTTGPGGNMATVNQGKITAFDPATDAITVTNSANARCMYYIENLPQLLDSAGEYYFSGGATFSHRLYVRLPGDRDPNSAIIEVGIRSKIISLVDRHHITVSGLSLGINTQPNPATHTHWAVFDGNNQAIELSGTCSDIEISNCTFRCIVNGISPRPGDIGIPNVMSDIRITDNEFTVVDDQVITIGHVSGAHTARDIQVLRNRIHDVGGRQTGRGYSCMPAILVGAHWAEIAGNILTYCWGVGIDGFWGRHRNEPSLSAPFIRGLVHHNKVHTSLLATNDWGGIEGMMGGPVYYYSNISANARGYRHFWATLDRVWGPAYYFDHAYAQKAFNNIAFGLHNSLTNPLERNSTAFQQCVGDHILYANNTAHCFYTAFSTSQPYDFYLGNLIDSISSKVHDETSDLSFTSYANNVYSGTARDFSTDQATFTEFQQYLSTGNAQSSQLGWEVSRPVMVDPAAGDFRPIAGGGAIDRGARIFVPWSLYHVSGEWHFYQHPADPTVVQGENFAMVANWTYSTPYNHLSCPGATLDDFVPGALEDWTNGALHFNGTSRYGIVTDAQSSAHASNDLDMTTNSFVLEAYLRTTATSGTVVSKGTTAGYELDIAPGGQARMRLVVGRGTYELNSAVTVNNGEWHHILAEVDRTESMGRMYVDGTLSNGTTTGTMPAADMSLTNTADFYVGRNASGNYFAGDMDFLRVSRGSLADAHTTIEELYAWEFDGPFLKDFAGNAPVGGRDAGALEDVNVGVAGAPMEIPVAFATPATPEILPFGAEQQTDKTGQTARETTAVSPTVIQAGIDRRLALLKQRRGMHAYLLDAPRKPEPTDALPAEEAAHDVDLTGGTTAGSPAGLAADAALPTLNTSSESPPRGAVAALAVLVGMAAAVLGLSTLGARE